MKTSINLTIQNFLCNGCGTCNVACPTDAISMKFNNIGQLEAKINEDKCINCGLCFKACPSYDQSGVVASYLNGESIVGMVKAVYTGRSTDKKIYENGQSGGVVTAILINLLKRGIIDAAIVCKVEFGQTYQSSPVVVTKPSELLNCQKSSYTPIDMVSALKQISAYQSVAVVGTGCHIQGVRTLQAIHGKKFSNIKFLIGLICDRVLANTAAEILCGNKFKHQNKRIIWRDKGVSYRNPRIMIHSENGEECVVPSWKRHALKYYLTPPRCLICHDKLNLGADIVVGDPWGMSNIDWSHGASVVIIRTSLGENIIKEVTANHAVELQNASLEELLDGQDIKGKSKHLMVYYSAYLQKGWLLPSYSNKIYNQNNPVVFTDALEQINQFEDDLTHNKEFIVRKFRHKLNWISLKIQLHKWIHFKF